MTEKTLIERLREEIKRWYPSEPVVVLMAESHNALEAKDAEIAALKAKPFGEEVAAIKAYREEIIEDCAKVAECYGDSEASAVVANAIRAIKEKP